MENLSQLQLPAIQDFPKDIPILPRTFIERPFITNFFLAQYHTEFRGSWAVSHSIRLDENPLRLRNKLISSYLALEGINDHSLIDEVQFWSTFIGSMLENDDSVLIDGYINAALSHEEIHRTTDVRFDVYSTLSKWAYKKNDAKVSINLANSYNDEDRVKAYSEQIEEGDAICYEINAYNEAISILFSDPVLLSFSHYIPRLLNRLSNSNQTMGDWDKYLHAVAMILTGDINIFQREVNDMQIEDLLFGLKQLREKPNEFISTRRNDQEFLHGLNVGMVNSILKMQKHMST